MLARWVCVFVHSRAANVAYIRCLLVVVVVVVVAVDGVVGVGGGDAPDVRVARKIIYAASPSSLHSGPFSSLLPFPILFIGGHNNPSILSACASSLPEKGEKTWRNSCSKVVHSQLLGESSAHGTMAKQREREREEGVEEKSTEKDELLVEAMQNGVSYLQCAEGPIVRCSSRPGCLFPSTPLGFYGEKALEGEASFTPFTTMKRGEGERGPYSARLTSLSPPLWRGEESLSLAPAF